MPIKLGEAVRFLAIEWRETWEFGHPSVLLEPVFRYSPNGTALDTMIEDAAIDISIDLETGAETPVGICGSDEKEFEWRGWEPAALKDKAEAVLRGEKVELGLGFVNVREQYLVFKDENGEVVIRDGGKEREVKRGDCMETEPRRVIVGREAMASRTPEGPEERMSKFVGEHGSECTLAYLILSLAKAAPAYDLNMLKFDLTSALRHLKKYRQENEVKVVFLTNLRDHPTVRSYQVGMAGEHHVVVGRHYDEGQLGLFIPPGCVVPEDMLREMWLWNDEHGKGRLGGRRGDRVRVKDMGGVTSEGLFYGATSIGPQGVREWGKVWNAAWRVGDDVTDEVGVKRG